MTRPQPITAHLQEPEEEHRDHAVLEAEALGRVVDMRHQVHEVAVVLVPVHQLLLHLRVDLIDRHIRVFIGELLGRGD